MMAIQNVSHQQMCLAKCYSYICQEIFLLHIVMKLLLACVSYFVDSV